MTAIALICGLGHTPADCDNPMLELAPKLSQIANTDVTSWSWRETRKIAIYLSAWRNVLLVGHSFGGDCAVEVARRLAPQAVNLVAVDPVPRSPLRRWCQSRIAVPSNVAHALCILRSHGCWPFAKRLSRGDHVIMSDTDHDSVMRGGRTHRLICEFALEVVR